MKKRNIALALLLSLCMLMSLLPTAALAEAEELPSEEIAEALSLPSEEPEELTMAAPNEGASALQYVKAVGEDTFTFATAPEEGTIGAYISGAWELTEDCTEIALVINNAAVTLGSGGAVNTEELYIFGTGSLKVGDVTFTAGHTGTISSGAGASDIVAAVKTDGNELLNISGEVKDGASLAVYKAIVPSGSTLSIAGDSSLTVSGSLAISGTLTARQDARLTVHGGATVTGLYFYDKDTTTSWTDFSRNVTFVWLESGEGEHAPEINKWVRFAESEGPGQSEYWFEYDEYDGALVTRDGDEKVIDSGAHESFTETEGSYETLGFTLTPPANRSTDTPIVEIEVFDGNEQKGNSCWRSDAPADDPCKLTLTNNHFSFTPQSDAGFIVRIWWSEFDAYFGEEGQYTIHTGGDDENGAITLSKTPVHIEKHGQECKNVFTVGTDVTLTFVPKDDCLLSLVIIGEETYETVEQIEKLYNPTTDYYEYTVKDAKEGESIYVEAHFRPSIEEFDPRWYAAELDPAAKNGQKAATATWKRPLGGEEEIEYTVYLYKDDVLKTSVTTTNTEYSFYDLITSYGYGFYCFQVECAENEVNALLSPWSMLLLYSDSVQDGSRLTRWEEETSPSYFTSFYVGKLKIDDPGTAEYLDKEYKPCTKEQAAYRIKSIEYSDYKWVSNTLLSGTGSREWSSDNLAYYVWTTCYLSRYERTGTVTVEALTPAASVTRTGDSNQPGLWLGIVSAGMIAGAALLLAKKKKA